ncbi:ABC transporter substrate-binding protein [Kineococcus sp. LSe6-4]|uniref:ABC transporter substrate-binding protein n=1 Tax=Kineococcus halophytocola TaxID=3234027 RepID=A0ABV4GZ11_9ACTN
MPPPPTRAPLTRRHVLAGAGAAAAVGATGACGAATTGGADGPLTFWSSLRGTENVVAAWNEARPDAPVQFSTVPSGGAGGNAKLSNAARAGNAPDVTSMEYADLPGFTLDGVTTDLTDLISPSFRDAILPQAWDTATFSGRTYAVPLDVEPMVFLHRPDLLARAGLDVPTTWEEFAEASATLKSRTGVDLASFFPNGWPWLAGYAQQLGARWFQTDPDAGDGGEWVVDLLDEPTQRVATLWQGLVDERNVQLVPQGSQEWLASLANDSTASFIVGAWGAANLITAVPGGAGKWRAAPLPQWAGQTPSLGVQGGSVHVITADSPRKERAMEFLEWMSTSPDSAVARLSSGTSAMFPAAPSLIGPAADQLDTSYYSGQDYYGFVSGQSELLDVGWLWGPRMQATGASLQDGLARLEYGTTIEEALAAAEEATLPDLRSLGLGVRRG